jgi:hypothetical protein
MVCRCLDYSGDGGLATSAQLNQPYSVTVDDDGNIYIADRDNYVIRKVNVSAAMTFGARPSSTRRG